MKQYLKDQEMMETINNRHYKGMQLNNNKSKPLKLMRMEDQKYEKKLENEISRLQTAFKSMPSPIKKKLIVNIVLSIAAFIAAAITSIILVAVGVSGYSSMAASVLLSGMRPLAIAQIRFFVLRMIADHKEIETPVIEFPDVSSPVFKYNDI